MVSPYLLRPVRNLKEVLNVIESFAPTHDPAPRQFSPSGVSGTAAAILRKQGWISRPRVVWVNEPVQRGVKSRKKD